ncbi:FAD:protein FMN transferase [Ligilactobacillus cholophilus]|uniref:FAD:protein FMN transferase n=1 Tax=Ligilactobacillus cholophilus TaxID=3050131 RepID=UPI0025B17037|nr:FAD:protein FMN transferase [Ligilactobacillus cholophilus]
MSIKTYNYSFRALGTNVSFTVFNKQSKVIFEPAKKIVNYYDKIFSIYKNDSEISKLNLNSGKKAVKVSDPTYDLIKISKEISLQNFGFNVAIGPLVKAWDIGTRNAKIPFPNEIEKLKKIINPEDIEILSNNNVYLKRKNMQLDLGAIGKGYIADRLKNLWQSYGIKSGIINLGGNLLLIGNCPLHSDGLWRIGIQDPWKKRGEAIKNVITPPCSVVTSGIYERQFIKNGKTFHHILDSKTGFPYSTNLMSVTVFCTTSLAGEIESSRLFFNNKITNFNPSLLRSIFVYKDHTINEFIKKQEM